MPVIQKEKNRPMQPIPHSDQLDGWDSHEAAILAALVSYDTTSSHSYEESQSNIPLIEAIQSYLKSYGAECQIFLENTPNGQKANLLARMGPDIKDAGVMYMGHTDVQPACRDDWNVCAPFELTEKDGALYGRGAVDMKGAIASMLAMVPDIADKQLDKPVYFGFTYDEEVGCQGVVKFKEKMLELGINPDLTIVGEPTQMDVVDSHMGSVHYKISVRGVSAHSSLKGDALKAPVSAIQYAANVANYIEQDLQQALMDPEKSKIDSRFTPSHNLVNVGVISGGVTNNTIAGHCDLFCHFRTLPNTDIQKDIIEPIERYCQELERTMQAVNPDCSITCEAQSITPGLPFNGPTPIIDQIVELSPGKKDSYAVTFATEAGQASLFSKQAIVCGPGSLSNNAHKPDEYILIKELAQARPLYNAVVDLLCAHKEQAQTQQTAQFNNLSTIPPQMPTVQM